MKISIILVCYNSEKYIKFALDSIVQQSYKNIELIVIDGGSSDQTLEIVKQYSSFIKLFISELDDGIYYAMNKGLKLATGDIVGFLNSDDFYASPKTLEIIHNALVTDVYDCCYGNLIYVSRENINCIDRYWDSSDFNPKFFSYGLSPPHPTFYISRKLLTKVGFFNTDYKLAADFDFMARCMFKYSSRNLYINRVLVYMRSGGATNKSLTNIILQNIEIIKSIRHNSLKFSFIKFLFNKLRYKLTRH